MRHRHYRKKRDRHPHHRHCQYINESSALLHEQDYSNDDSTQFKDSIMTPQSLSLSQTRDQITQCIDESVSQLHSCAAKPSPTTGSSSTTKLSPATKLSFSAESSPTAKLSF